MVHMVFSNKKFKLKRVKYLQDNGIKRWHPENHIHEHICSIYNSAKLWFSAIPT